MLISTNEIVSIYALKKRKAIELKTVIASKLKQLQMPEILPVETNAETLPKAFISFTEIL